MIRRGKKGKWICVVCKNELPIVAIRHQDPFCSTPCARLWFGTELPPPTPGKPVGASS